MRNGASTLQMSMLAMLTRKWNIRCEMMEDEGRTIEEEEQRERCDVKCAALQESDLLRGDRYLLGDRFRPYKELRVTSIREWERTLDLKVMTRCLRWSW